MSGIPQLLKKNIFVEPMKEANPILPGAEVIYTDGPVSLAYGGSLSEMQIAFETFGKLSKAKDNVVLLMPAFCFRGRVRTTNQVSTSGLGCERGSTTC